MFIQKRSPKKSQPWNHKPRLPCKFRDPCLSSVWGSGSFIRYEQENVTEPSFSWWLLGREFRDSGSSAVRSPCVETEPHLASENLESSPFSVPGNSITWGGLVCLFWKASSCSRLKKTVAWLGRFFKPTPNSPHQGFLQLIAFILLIIVQGLGVTSWTFFQWLCGVFVFFLLVFFGGDFVIFYGLDSTVGFITIKPTTTHFGKIYVIFFCNHLKQF